MKMAFDMLRLITRALLYSIPYGIHVLKSRLYAVHHRWTYRAVADPKNVVVIGGSFGGMILARRLSETLPTGYRVILIERNSRFSYLFAFPRFSVVPGHEKKAFIPYDEIIGPRTPAGVFERFQASVTSISLEYGEDKGKIFLEGGNKLSFEFLAIATGTSSTLPAKPMSTFHVDAAGELRSMQEKIQDSHRIAVLGGGAVGVEVASDIQSFYRNEKKEVTLFCSRSSLLPGFSRLLGDAALDELTEIGVRCRLNQRPILETDLTAVKLPDGSLEHFDLIISCTGQTPNSHILENILPEAVSATTKRILVKPTLQIKSQENGRGETVATEKTSHEKLHDRIFSLGDVAETGGPKMGRACLMQAEVVVHNILALINGQTQKLKSYHPRRDMEGAIKLTVGIEKCLLFSQDDNGWEVLLKAKGGKNDFDISRGWAMLGATYGDEKISDV